jgi:hypothetical protein
MSRSSVQIRPAAPSTGHEFPLDQSSHSGGGFHSGCGRSRCLRAGGPVREWSADGFQLVRPGSDRVSAEQRQDQQHGELDLSVPSQQAVFNAAKATWESLITGWKDTVGISSVSITVNLENIDGPGNILGSAGPDTGIITPNYLYTTSGSMTFDTSDIPGLGAAFGDVVLHEMGHVLGIGTLWSASFATGGFVTGRQEVYVNNSGQYTGAYGLAAYNAEFGQSGAFIPVELGGGPGTANGHWNEVDGGAGLTGIVGPQGDFRNELMTGWLNAPSYISNTTVQSLQDIGFNVIPEPAPFALVALGGLLMVRRRRE